MRMIFSQMAKKNQAEAVQGTQMEIAEAADTLGVALLALDPPDFA